MMGLRVVVKAAIKRVFLLFRALAGYYPREPLLFRHIIQWRLAGAQSVLFHGASQRIPNLFRPNPPSFLLPTRARHLRLPPPVKECRLALEEFRGRRSFVGGTRIAQCTFFHREIDDQGTVAGHVGR
jgi:hypothetical protein